MTDETIFALSSGRARGAVAVIRVSGPAAAAAIRGLTGAPPDAPRRAGLRTLRSADGEVLDRGLVLWFASPASATGEDVAEFHVHGGRACTEAVLAALAAVPGLRPAAAGEFTRRAFVNGRLDLTQAEAVGDLVAAETAAQRRQALMQMQGALGARYETWRARLIALSAHLEAVIDFADEELPEGVDREVVAGVTALAAEIERHLKDGRRGQRLRDGVDVAIVGAPNAGKSSLLNALAGREAAIVSAHPGTTRDVVEVALDIGGYPVILADTAGLRAGGDPVEEEGVRRARRRAAAAELRLVVIDGARFPHVEDEVAELAGSEAIVVISKSDCHALPPAPQVSGRPALAVSAVTGAGLDRLVAVMTERLAQRFGVGEAPALTRERHRHGLEQCQQALRRALTVSAVEERAEELRAAAVALGRITGRIDIDELLDVVFRDFCIGK